MYNTYQRYTFATNTVNVQRNDTSHEDVICAHFISKVIVMFLSSCHIHAPVDQCSIT